MSCVESGWREVVLTIVVWLAACSYDSFCVDDDAPIEYDPSSEM